MKVPKLGKKESKKTEKEKLEERREEVLAQGRKFKYPLQYAKHRLIIITSVIILVAMMAAGALGYVMLYKVQNTGDVVYRLTTVLPVSVAKIDGEKVKYSDYLMIYRSSVTPIEQQNGTEDDEESLRDYYKRVALTTAEDYTYAGKLAKQLGVIVTDAQVDQAFTEHRKVGGTERSQESFLKVLKDNFGLTETEYKRMLYLSLLKVEVSRKIDTEAEEKAAKAEQMAKDGKGLREIAEELEIEYEETGGLVDVMNVDGGRANRAYGMNKGEVSDKFVSTSGDGYYILRLNDKEDGKVNYVSVFIKFTELDKRLKNTREENRVEEYIELKSEG